KLTSITCDNASSNDPMVHSLQARLPAFDAAKDRTRCFAHIISLVAKSLLKMFDPPKKASADADTDQDGDRGDEDPSGGIDLDELLAEPNDMELTEDEHDDEDDIFDEVVHMLEAERNLFLEQTKEIRSALVKVCIHPWNLEYFCLFEMPCPGS
ncbi:hypothetical protein B0H10DRAFT_1813386, partial [Mycena sp. CBHHK59/15]